MAPLHKTSLGCCWKQCITMALMSYSDPNLQIFSTFLRGPNTLKSHTGRSQLYEDGPTPSSIWSMVYHRQYMPHGLARFRRVTSYPPPPSLPPFLLLYCSSIFFCSCLSCDPPLLPQSLSLSLEQPPAAQNSWRGKGKGEGGGHVMNRSRRIY
jgi:hypothetical protein